MQHQITQQGSLLKENGDLREPGYAKSLLLNYDRSAIKAGKLRIKEWDYYLITNPRFGVALTIADNSYMGLDSVSFLHFEEVWEKTQSYMQFLTLGGKKLPRSSQNGNVASAGKHYAITFERLADKRVLRFNADKFLSGKAISGEIMLSEEPQESMVIATPFDKPGHFYYNQKINCLRAEGKVVLGSQVYSFDPRESFGVLDWGRGVWTYDNTWYWGSASGEVAGKTFGWNIGYGFGDTAAASENMLFYDGKAHKLSQVRFNIPLDSAGKEDYLKPWTFSSDDGRFEMDFVPILDRSALTSLKLIESDQHQVFGLFTGKAVLDDGEVVEVKGFLGFAEKVRNKW